MDKIDPTPPIPVAAELLPSGPVDGPAANQPPLDLATVLVLDPRILMADTDAYSEITRQMSEALAALSTAEWLLLGQVVEENAA